ncbi:MAG: methyltransferase [Clostridia bacterium]|nr:methyltransferase [Clostridia bacterium]
MGDHSENYILEDLMLNGFKIYQSPSLYRFTSDAVVLSRFAKKGAKRVMDLCSGSGIVGLHYYAVNQGEGTETVTLCELQRPLAEMSEETVKVNGLENVFTVLNQPLQTLSETGEYDLVMCNPPYKKRGSGIRLSNEHLDICRNETAVTLEEIVSKAAGLLSRGGRLCMCNAVDRLIETVVLFEKNKIYPSRNRFVSAKEDKDPYLFLIEGIKGKRSALVAERQSVNASKNFSGE